MSDASAQKKSTCLYCGNNPVNHTAAYINQTMNIAISPIIQLTSYFEGNFLTQGIKILLIPYTFIFRTLGLLSFSNDITGTRTDRSQVIWEEAKRRGIEMEQMVIVGKPVEHYRAKIEGRWQYFESLPVPPWMTARSYTWMDNKIRLKKKLANYHIAHPKGRSVTTLDHALHVFRELGKPVIIKPELGSRGRHTTTYISTEKDLEQGFDIAKQLCFFVVIEEHLMGSVYRATYVGGEIVGILRGDPPRITGDGIQTIRQLIDEKNQNKKDPVKDVVVDVKMMQFLDRQGLTLNSVLPQGNTIDLSEKIGVNYGGYAVEMLPQTHPKILSELKRAGDMLKAPIVGFDFIVDDPREDPTGKKWGIIEANSLPFINLHHHPVEGEPQNVAGKVWDLWKKPKKNWLSR